MIITLENCSKCGNKPTVVINLPNIIVKCCKLECVGTFKRENDVFQEWNNKNKLRAKK